MDKICKYRLYGGDLEADDDGYLVYYNDCLSHITDLKAHVKELEVERELTCGCGIHIHPSRWSAQAVHCTDCRWQTKAATDNLRALLQDVTASGVEHNDPRIGYLSVQIDRDTWNEIKAALAGKEV